MELYCFGNCIGRTERLYLGRETRTVWEGLFILKDSRNRRESKMRDVGKSRGWIAKEESEEGTKQSTSREWKDDGKFERESWINILQSFPLGITVSDV